MMLSGLTEHTECDPLVINVSQLMHVLVISICRQLMCVVVDWESPQGGDDEQCIKKQTKADRQTDRQTDTDTVRSLNFHVFRSILWVFDLVGLLAFGQDTATEKKTHTLDVDPPSA